MKKIIIGLIMLTGVTFMPSAIYAQASSNQKVADEIINIVKAQWAAEIANPGNVTEQFKDIADDYTEFNGEYATRLEGKSIAIKLFETSPVKAICEAEPKLMPVTTEPVVNKS